MDKISELVNQQSANRLVNQSVNQLENHKSANRSTNQSVNQWINQSNYLINSTKYLQPPGSRLWDFSSNQSRLSLVSFSYSSHPACLSGRTIAVTDTVLSCHAMSCQSRRDSSHTMWQLVKSTWNSSNISSSSVTFSYLNTIGASLPGKIDLYC